MVTSAQNQGQFEETDIALNDFNFKNMGMSQSSTPMKSVLVLHLTNKIKFLFPFNIHTLTKDPRTPCEIETWEDFPWYSGSTFSKGRADPHL
jgi:hypothetical protein